MGKTAITLTLGYVEQATLTSKFFSTNYISLKYFEKKEIYFYKKVEEVGL